MTTNHQILRELAEKAPREAWKLIQGYSDWGMPKVHMVVPVDWDESAYEDVIAEITSFTPYCIGASRNSIDLAKRKNAIAEFMAAANPQTILALLDDVEALRVDAERYRKIRDAEVTIGVGIWLENKDGTVNLNGWLIGEEADEAIDAARHAQGDKA